MNNYIATIRIRGRTARTRIAADSSLQARWLLEFMFGADSLISVPTLGEAASRCTTDAIQLYLADNQIYPTSAPAAQSADRARIAQLRAQKNRAAQALKTAQQQSRVAKAKRQLQTALQAQDAR